MKIYFKCLVLLFINFTNSKSVKKFMVEFNTKFF